MVVIYGRPNCRHCEVARSAAADARLSVDYRDVTRCNHTAERELLKLAGLRTVPQVFYLESSDGSARLIGGCREFLQFLEQRQKDV